MALKPRVDLVEGVKLFNWQVTSKCQYDIKCNRGMALAQNEAVTLIPIRTFWIDFQFIEVEMDQKIGGGEGTT